MDVKTSCLPKRRTALVYHELSCFNIDVAALSEIRLAGEGNIQEVGSGYTIFWKGKEPDEQCLHRVGFAVKSRLVEKHNLLPTAVSERLMTLRIPLTHGNHLIIMSVYASTLVSDNITKNDFYELLDSAIRNTPPSNKLIILGDFNARVRQDHHTWHGILSRHGIRKCNSNGLLLLGLCTEHEMTVTNSLFCLPNGHKTTW